MKTPNNSIKARRDADSSRFISNQQKTQIHVYKQRLNLLDEEYEGLLEGYGVTTSKDLSFADAKDLIRYLAGKAKGLKKYDELGDRPGKATPAQLRKIEALWNGVTRAEGNRAKALALKHFLNKRFSITGMKQILTEEVGGIIATLEIMNQM